MMYMCCNWYLLPPTPSCALTLSHSMQAREDGRAQWLHRAPPTLVVGAERDAVVDLEGVQETAAFLGISAKVLEGLPHDCMLAAGWEGAADQIIEWVKAQASEGRQGQGPQ